MMSDIVERLRKEGSGHSGLKLEAADEILRLREESKRKEAQIAEAIAILRNGTDYEKAHVVAILADALDTN